MNYDCFDRRFGAVFPDACHGLFRGVSLGRDAGGATLRACCPKGMERGSATRSSPECRTGAGNSMDFQIVERAAAETAALRRLQNDLGNTPSRCARWRDERGFAVDVSSVLCILICAETMKAPMDTKNRFFCAKSSPPFIASFRPGKKVFLKMVLTQTKPCD